MLFHRDRETDGDPLAEVHMQAGLLFVSLIMVGGVVYGLWWAVESLEEIVTRGAGFVNTSILAIGVGGAMWLAERVARLAKDGPRRVQDAAGRREHPHEPWLWREEWAANRIDDHTANEALRAAAVAVTSNITIVFLLRHAPPAGAWPAILVLFFAVLFIVAIVATAFAVYLVLRWKKFGTTSLVLDDVPARLGRSLTGTVRIRTVKSMRARELKIRMTLTNLLFRFEERTSRLTDEVREITCIVRQEEVLVVPVSVPIPPGGNATYAGEHKEVGWRLRVSAACPGIDYSARFDVPVFG